MYNRMNSGVISSMRLHFDSRPLRSCPEGLHICGDSTTNSHRGACQHQGRLTSASLGLVSHPSAPMRVHPAARLLLHTFERVSLSRPITMFARLSACASARVTASARTNGPGSPPDGRHARAYAQRSASTAEGRPLHLPAHGHAGERGDAPAHQRACRCTGRHVDQSARRPPNTVPSRPAPRPAHRAATPPAHTPATSSAITPAHSTAHMRTSQSTGLMDNQVTHQQLHLTARL